MGKYVTKKQLRKALSDERKAFIKEQKEATGISDKPNTERIQRLLNWYASPLRDQEHAEFV